MVDLERTSTAVVATLAAIAVLTGPALAAEESAPNLGDAIRSQIMPCWNPPIGREVKTSVRLRFLLKRDGSLDGEPSVLDPSLPPKSAVGAAVRAVRRCAPLKLPTESYDTWREIIINFDPAGIQ